MEPVQEKKKTGAFPGSSHHSAHQRQVGSVEGYGALRHHLTEGIGDDGAAGQPFPPHHPVPLLFDAVELSTLPLDIQPVVAIFKPPPVSTLGLRHVQAPVSGDPSTPPPPAHAEGTIDPDPIS